MHPLHAWVWFAATAACLCRDKVPLRSPDGKNTGSKHQSRALSPGRLIEAGRRWSASVPSELLLVNGKATSATRDGIADGMPTTRTLVTPENSRLD